MSRIIVCLKNIFSEMTSLMIGTCLPSSLLECNQGLHDPRGDVLLCRRHCWNHVFCTVFLSFWKLQPLLCCRNHVFCLQWVFSLLIWNTLITRLIADYVIIIKADIYLLFSFFCSTGYGHLYWSDCQPPGTAFWRLALLLVLHSGLGGHAHDLLCW